MPEISRFYGIVIRFHPIGTTLGWMAHSRAVRIRGTSGSGDSQISDLRQPGRAPRPRASHRPCHPRDRR